MFAMCQYICLDSSLYFGGLNVELAGFRTRGFPVANFVVRLFGSATWIAFAYVQIGLVIITVPILLCLRYLRRIIRETDATTCRFSAASDGQMGLRFARAVTKIRRVSVLLSVVVVVLLVANAVVFSQDLQDDVEEGASIARKADFELM